jgi:hypothetical protein
MESESDRYRIRPGRKSDAAGLADLHASVQLQFATGGRPHPGIAAWVEDLMDGHPSVTPADFLVAEDAATGRPVASLVSIRQTWNLGTGLEGPRAGVRLPVAQIELVGTAPEHRGNRLTERLFSALHQRHADDGAAIQMIEGIPYFYRRLGYDYALANDGAPTVPAAAVASVGEGGPTVRAAVASVGEGGPTVRAAVASAGEGGPTVRPAIAEDAEALAGIDRQISGGDALTCPRDAAVWRYEISGRRPADISARRVAVLVRDAEVCGYLVHGDRLSAAGELPVFAAACAQPADWPHAAPAMHAYLGEIGRGLTGFTAVRRILSPGHPLVRLGPAGVPRRPRGWYIRCADPIDLLTRLQPLRADDGDGHPRCRQPVNRSRNPRGRPAGGSDPAGPGPPHPARSAGTLAGLPAPRPPHRALPDRRLPQRAGAHLAAGLTAPRRGQFSSGAETFLRCVAYQAAERGGGARLGRPPHSCAGRSSWPVFAGELWCVAASWAGKGA